MEITNTIRIWPPEKYPLIRRAKRVFRLEGETALKTWVASLSPIQKGALAAEIIRLLSETEKRDPIEVALEIFFGKGNKQ